MSHLKILWTINSMSSKLENFLIVAGNKKSQLGEDIQEWTKQNFWKTSFKKFEMILSVRQTISFQTF